METCDVWRCNTGQSPRPSALSRPANGCISVRTPEQKLTNETLGIVVLKAYSFVDTQFKTLHSLEIVWQGTSVSNEGRRIQANYPSFPGPRLPALFSLLLVNLVSNSHRNIKACLYHLAMMDHRDTIEGNHFHSWCKLHGCTNVFVQRATFPQKSEGNSWEWQDEN